jgi:hypothetical protein
VYHLERILGHIFRIVLGVPNCFPFQISRLKFCMYFSTPLCVLYTLPSHFIDPPNNIREEHKLWTFLILLFSPAFRFFFPPSSKQAGLLSTLFPHSLKSVWEQFHTPSTCRHWNAQAQATEQVSDPVRGLRPTAVHRSVEHVWWYWRVRPDFVDFLFNICRLFRRLGSRPLIFIHITTGVHAVKNFESNML